MGDFLCKALHVLLPEGNKKYDWKQTCNNVCSEKPVWILKLCK